MWHVTTDDGCRVSEHQVLWPQLPKDTCISELVYTPRRGKAMGLRQCEAYGFQRFRVDVPNGIVGHGAQIIGVKGNDAIIVEFNEVTGETTRRAVPRSQLTYAPELLRAGTR